MRSAESFIGQPIRSLQTMLQVLSVNDSRYIRVIPDGIYGPETMRAVSIFQRNHGLPVTGVTDLATWEAIVARFEPALVEQTPAQGLQIILNPGQVIRKGECSPHMYLVQSILKALSDIYKSVSQPSLSGSLDTITSDSLASFQALCALPMTGTLDKHTWKHLVLQYPLATSLKNPPG